MDVRTLFSAEHHEPLRVPASSIETARGEKTSEEWTYPLTLQLPRLGARSLTQRDAITEQLRLHGFPNDAEAKALCHLGCHLPLEKWGAYLLAWSRSVQAYGASLQDFANSKTVVRPRKLFNQNHLIAEYSSGIDYSGERGARVAYERTGDTTRYQSRRGRPLAYEKGCVLCENVEQYFDAEQPGSTVKINGILRIGDSLLEAARFPRFPGSSILVPFGHDERSTRAMAGRDGISSTRHSAQEESKTRGRLLSPKALHQLFWVSDLLDMVGMRTPPVEAINVPRHDHFDLHPADHRVFLPLKSILSTKPFAILGDGRFTLECSPFSTLVVTAANRRDLAIKGSSILDSLERDNQLFSPVYYRRHLFITPLRGTNDFSSIGGGAGIHLLDSLTPEYIAKLDEAVPKQGQFAWSRYRPH